MNDFARAFQALFSRVADFFDILDLSFVVSGAATIGALAAIAHRLGAVDPGLVPTTSLGYFALLLACYVLGLVSFAVGRSLRRMRGSFIRGEEFTARITKAVQDHALDDAGTFRAYFEDVDKRGAEPADGKPGATSTRQAARLYVRLWVHVRQRESLKPSFQLLRRAWVLAATYDGLAAAFALWGVALGIWGGFDWVSARERAIVELLVCAAAVGAVFVCFQEALRHQENQIEELVAVSAAYPERFDPQPTAQPAPGTLPPAPVLGGAPPAAPPPA